MTLQNLFDDYYRPLRLRGRSANTSRLYGCTIRSFWKWLRHEPTIDDLTDLTISRFLEHRGSTRSPYTAEKERTQLIALWRFAADRGFVRDRPCVPPAPLPDRIPEAWSVDQLRSLVRAAVATPGRVGTVPAGKVTKVAIIASSIAVAPPVVGLLACIRVLKLRSKSSR